MSLAQRMYTDAVAPDEPPEVDEPKLQSGPAEPTPLAVAVRQRLVKLVPWILAVVIVVVIVTIIRITASGSDPGSLTPTTVKPDGSAPVATIPVSSSVRAAFAAASAQLDVANETVTRALASGSNQTVAQVAQEVTPYSTALNTFNFRTHFLAWPQSVAVQAEDVTLRTKALISFLDSISSTSQVELSSWYTQLHALATQTQTAENLVRKDLGMSPTSSYPT